MRGGKYIRVTRKFLQAIDITGTIPGERNGNALQYSCLEKSHGQRNLVGYHPWGPNESDTT